MTMGAGASTAKTSASRESVMQRLSGFLHNFKVNLHFAKRKREKIERALDNHDSDTALVNQEDLAALEAKNLEHMQNVHTASKRLEPTVGGTEIIAEAHRESDKTSEQAIQKAEQAGSQVPLPETGTGLDFA